MAKNETDLRTANAEDSSPKPEKLVLQNDGNLVLIDVFHQARWSSGTDDICSQGL